MANNSVSGSRPGLSLTPLFQISKDAQGSDNPIPLSPQLPKPGESKPGVGTGESNPLSAYGNHSDNTEEMHDQKKKDVFRPSLPDMETGRRDRWRQSHGPGIKEPSPSIPELQQNEIPTSQRLRVKLLSENAVMPSRRSPLSAGCDLSSASVVKVPARGKALIPTDLRIAIPEGTYGRIANRSGLTSGLLWDHSIAVDDGVIDVDYRGPVEVLLLNHSDVDYEVKVGDKIAQLIICKEIVTPNVMEVEDLDATVRGAGGVGSTGV